MSVRTATCSCGALRVLAEDEPVRISVCHCLACQRRTGSVFGTQARFPEQRVRIEGESREYARRGDSGATIRFHFCPDCGATVYYRLDSAPGAIAVPVGAFADPDFPPPRVEVYPSHRHRWLAMPGNIESHDQHHPPPGERAMAKSDRDLTRSYSRSQFAAKLRRLADAIETGKAFAIQVAGERLRIPADVTFNIEHERAGADQELEFQLLWKAED